VADVAGLVPLYGGGVCGCQFDLGGYGRYAAAMEWPVSAEYFEARCEEMQREREAEWRRMGLIP